MSNLAAFSNVVRRAQIKADKRIKGLEAIIQAMLETAEGAGIPRCQFDEDLKGI